MVGNKKFLRQFTKHYITTDIVYSTQGAGRSSKVERSLMVLWVVGSILNGVDPLSSTTGVTKAVVCVILSVGWCI